MKNLTKIRSAFVAFIVSTIMISCGGDGKSAADRIKEQAQMAPTDPYENWESNNGIGPIKSLDLPAEIDQALATKGQEIYEGKCTACHKAEKKFIGPSPKGILERRTAAWVMNMILNPDEMVQKDPMAKKLLMEFNGSPMANQNLTEDEARAVLEFFRTL
ncbi:MAG: cytochrome c [Cyclobacteriaceae bacterium]